MKNFKNYLIGGALLMAAPLTFTSCEDILGHWEKPTPATPAAPVLSPISKSLASVATDAASIDVVDGDVIGGKVSSTGVNDPTYGEHAFFINVPDGASITLQNVEPNSAEQCLVINCPGDATINLEGNNSISQLKAQDDTGNLTINSADGTGVLTVDFGLSNGNAIITGAAMKFTLNSGTLIAKCLNGTSSQGVAGSIIVNGGTLKAKGTHDGVGGHLTVNGTTAKVYTCGVTANGAAAHVTTSGGAVVFQSDGSAAWATISGTDATANTASVKYITTDATDGAAFNASIFDF